MSRMAALDRGGGSSRRRRLSDENRDAWTGLTLGAVLGNPHTPVQMSRTLLDIIRDEEPNSDAYKNLVDHDNNKKNWKSFKDRLRLKSAGNAWSAATAASTSTTSTHNNRTPMLSRHNSSCMAVNADDSDVPEQPRRGQITRRLSTRLPSSNHLSPAAIEAEEPPQPPAVVVENPRIRMLRRNSSSLPSFSRSTQSDPFNEHESAAPNIRLSEALAAEREQIQRVVSSSSEANAEAEEMEGNDTVTEGAGQQPVRMSLMDLLEETDRQMGWVSYADGGEEEEEEEAAMDDISEGGCVTEYACCVCMVRHKGAAFIPCGHTFCRLCSRELMVTRGNCPLCNGFILEILDIF